MSDIAEVQEKTLNPEEIIWDKAQINNELNPHIAPGRNQTWVALVGGKQALSPLPRPCSPI